MSLETDPNDPNKVFFNYKVGAEQVGEELPELYGKWYGWADLGNEGVLYLFCNDPEQFFDTKEEAENYAIEAGRGILNRSIAQFILHMGVDPDVQ